MTTKSFFSIMSDGAELCINQWIPDSTPKAVILITHGMAEHSLRYDRTASFLVDAGFAVVAYDERGHGKTAQKAKEKGEVGFGYLADKKGYKRVVEDLHELILKAKTEFSNQKIFLLSHSFGSIITQNYIENFSSECDGVILCGTRGPMQFLVKSGKILGGLLYLFGQKKRQSKLLDKIAFGGYNKKIQNPRTPFDWLTKDSSIVDLYIADAWCGNVMTTEFYFELMSVLADNHKKSNMKKIQKDLPIFMIAGSDDPVGSYGKTVTNLFNIYKKNGIEDIELKLYENNRHEILNETDSDKVINDIINWITKRL